MKGAIFLLLVMVIVSIQVNAVSVVSDYLANGTMVLAKGASKTYGIRLQNPTDNEVGIKLDYDANFMRVMDYKVMYTLPPKSTGYSISFNVTAPKKPGLYKVGYTVSEVEPGGSGGLPIRLKINKTFNLKVVDPNEFNIDYYKAGYIAVLAALAFFLLKITRGKIRRNRKINKEII